MSIGLYRDETAKRPAAPRQRGAGGRPGWSSNYVGAVVLVDALACLVAGVLAQVARFGSVGGTLSTPGLQVPYTLLTVGTVPLWLAAMALSGAYDGRRLGTGSDEYRRVFDGGVRVLATVAVVVYALGVNLARTYVAIAIPAALGLTLLARHAVRKVVHKRRARGLMTYQVLVVGSLEATTALIRHLCGSPYAGFTVLGACVPGGAASMDVDGNIIPVLGDPHEIERIVFESSADAVAVATIGDLPGGSLQSLGWALEGTGVDLIVAPALTDVAGPRIVTRPVAGLPLLHVEEPELSGPARLFKECFDRVIAGLVLTAGLPMYAAVVVAIRLTSPGPAFFRQVRVGRGGHHFTIHKFRTMRASAEVELASLQDRNEHDGVLFKIRDDPRRTKVGRLLRRFSIDELPQLWNVVRGDMSIVGPRPPLPSEVERYADHVKRRLLVKPGMTGLWQVSGRADLSWEESIRLDLYYVENWSPAMDGLILWKTIAAVLHGRGAY